MSHSHGSREINAHCEERQQLTSQQHAVMHCEWINSQILNDKRPNDSQYSKNEPTPFSTPAIQEATDYSVTKRKWHYFDTMFNTVSLSSSFMQ